MKIDRVSIFRTTYTPKGGRLQLSGGRSFSQFLSAVVRIDTDEGVVGWGEHASAPQYMTALHGGAVSAIAEIAPALIGKDPRQIVSIHQTMDRAVKGHAYAKSAVDIACWDIAAKAMGVPLATLLGGIFQEEFPIVNVVHLDRPERMREQSDALFEEGYSTVQVKVGGDWREDVRRIEATYESAQRFNTTIIDANAHWTQHEAINVVAATRGMALMIEQPCNGLGENLTVKAAADHPFVLDESLDGLPAFYEANRRNGFDCAMLKLSRFGGILPLRHARDCCVHWGKAVTMEDMAGSDIIAAVAAHLAASTPPQNLVCGAFATQFVNESIAEGLWQSKGRGRVPTAPGLGIVVNESLLGEPLTSFT